MKSLLVLIMLAATAQAELIPIVDDDSPFRYSFDTETNLEWLHPRAPGNKFFDEVLVMLEPGGMLEEYRLATRGEIEPLMLSYDDDQESVEYFIDTIGFTGNGDAGTYATQGYYDLGWAGIYFSGDIKVQIGDIDRIPARNDIPDPWTGYWIVRERGQVQFPIEPNFRGEVDPIQIPEPSAVFLAIIGLISIYPGSLRSRKP